MTHLKDEAYYIALYDSLTIEHCRFLDAQAIDKQIVEEIQSSNDAKLKAQLAHGVAVPDIIYVAKGERFREKADTIREWMDRDRAKDERVTNTPQPTDIRCPHCGLTMNCMDRDLWTRSGHHEEQVLFTFTCSHCNRGRGIWEDGAEWESPPSPCPKCQTPMMLHDKRVGNTITTTSTCPSCHHKGLSTLELGKKYEEPVDPNFEEDRVKYCMSQKEGFDYIQWMDGIKDLLNTIEEREKNKAVYSAVAKIKTLPIADLQGILNSVIQKAGYTNFVLGAPEFLRGVTVEFATQDTQVGRSEYDSKQSLKKLLENVLKETNWRLMNDGISYRLGFLSGCLRGVEGEEALVELAKHRFPKKNDA